MIVLDDEFDTLGMAFLGYLKAQDLVYRAIAARKP
jgi:hypothetical protein